MSFAASQVKKSIMISQSILEIKHIFSFLMDGVSYKSLKEKQSVGGLFYFKEGFAILFVIFNLNIL